MADGDYVTVLVPQVSGSETPGKDITSWFDVAVVDGGRRALGSRFRLPPAAR
jgi:hypothetical protein